MPVTSLCPSLEGDLRVRRAQPALDRHDRACGRASRSFVAELLRVAEEEASCELFGILKRADEKFVTERAYDNPRFVEDLVRGVAARLDADARLEGFVVEAENFESIHNHSAYARIARGW